MSNYIDRDVAIKMIAKDAPDLVYYNKEEAIDCLECVPIADVKEVRHGHWMLSDETDVWKCSECGHLTSERIFKQYRDINGNTCYQSENPFYCSRCGAKMDL